MNRIKLWIFTILVVVAGWFALQSLTAARRADALAGLDARLASAAAHVAGSTRAIGREASAAAAFVARDGKLAGALQAKDAAPPPPKGKKAPVQAPEPVDPDAEEASLREVTRQALSGAERVLGFDLPGTTVVTAANREWLARKGGGEGDAMAFLRAAIDGQAKRGFLRHEGALWYGAAAPSGDGAGVVVRVPLDERWARTVSTAAGADVTLAAQDVKPVSTARAADAASLPAVAARLAAPGDVGRPAGVELSVGPIKLPRLPHPVGSGAPLRARSVPIEGLPGAFAVVSIPTSAALDPASVSYWWGVGALALVLLGGLVLGLFVRPSESAPQIPDGLYAAAVRIDAGDFAARAPALAGKLGTVAAALNRAAELAGPNQAARSAPPPAAGATGEWYQGPARAAAAAEPEPFPAPRQTAAIPAAQGGRTAAALAAVPAPAAPVPEVDEEAHWQQVFQDFLRTRESCSEPTEGLTYEKFRQKLEGNKAQLVAKYACKTVRFQVYVKDGKAALKATPVK